MQGHLSESFLMEKNMSHGASVVLTHRQSNQSAVLGPGDFIGRSEVAALCLDDPRVSEAHAMVSLRDGSLKLIALRGRFRQGEEVLSEAVLRPGVVLEFARDVHLVCEQVHMPDEVLGLLINAELKVMLTHTMTLYTSENMMIKRGYDPRGGAIFWTTGSLWRVQIADQPSLTLEQGQTFIVDQTRIEVIAIPLDRIAQTHTRNSLRSPLRFTCHDTHVEIARVNEPTIKVSGVPGRILLSLLRRQGTASYQEIVKEVWPHDVSTNLSLRRRFDTGIRRLRTHLGHVLPVDETQFIQLDGTGVVTLFLSPRDEIASA